MDGLGSISLEQVWTASSSSASANSMTNYIYSSHSPRPPSHHHHTQQPRLQPSTDSSADAAEGRSSSSSSSSHAVLRPQRSSGTAGLSVAVVQLGGSSSSSSSTAAVRDRLFEPLDAGAGRDHSRDQRPQPAGQPMPIAPARRRTLPAALHPSSPSTNTFATSSSSSSMGLLQRRHSSGTSSSSSSILSNTAGQLLSSLSALGSLSRLSSSPVGGTNSNAGSSRSSSSRSQSQLPVGRVQVRPSALGASRSALRHVLLVRSPAVLLDTPGSSSEWYDDLLALDQFNVKRAVKPLVLASLPTRGADEADLQQAAHCFICFEPWRPQLAAAAAAAGAPAGSEGYPEKGAAAAVTAAGAVNSAAAGVCRCRCRCNPTAGVHEGAALPRNTAASDAVVLDVIAVQQQQQQQQRLGCFGGWGAGMFRQTSAPLGSHAATAAGAAAAAASRSPGAEAHVEVALQAAAVKPAPPVTILQLPCGHEFCVGCIGTWLAEHVTCPICRWSFPEAQTQLINMHK